MVLSVAEYVDGFTRAVISVLDKVEGQMPADGYDKALRAALAAETSNEESLVHVAHWALCDGQEPLLVYNALARGIGKDMVDESYVERNGAPGSREALEKRVRDYAISRLTLILSRATGVQFLGEDARRAIDEYNRVAPPI